MVVAKRLSGKEQATKRSLLFMPWTTSSGRDDHGGEVR